MPLLWNFHLTSSHRFIRVQRVQPYSSTDTAIAWKKSRFILSKKLDFHIINNVLIIVDICRTSHWANKYCTRPFWCFYARSPDLPGSCKKCLRPRHLSFKKGVPQGPVNKPNPGRVRAWGTVNWGSSVSVLACPTWMPVSRHSCLMASTDYHHDQDTHDQICAPTNTADRSVSRCRSITVHAFLMHILLLLTNDEILLLRYVNWSANFRGLPHKKKKLK